MRCILAVLCVAVALMGTTDSVRAQYGCPTVGGNLSLQSGSPFIQSPGADTLVAHNAPAGPVFYSFGLSIFPSPITLTVSTCESGCTLICSPPYLTVMAGQSFSFTTRPDLPPVAICVQAVWLEAGQGNCLNVSNVLVAIVQNAP